MTRDPFEASYVSGAVIPNSATTTFTAARPLRRGQSTAMTHPVQAPAVQAFKPGTLYAVLLYRNDFSSWHWALFLPYDSPHPLSPSHKTMDMNAHEESPNASTSWPGNIWHCTNTNTRGRWTYEELAPDALDLPTRLVLAARLADLSSLGSPPEVAAALSDILASVPVRADAHKSVFNCRTWMLDGIGELDDGGFLSCVSTMALERELIAAAQLATPKYEEDGSYVMITPRNCSDN